MSFLASNPFIIAEISGNHGGDLNSALDLAEQACLSGADAVKIQTYVPTDLTHQSNHPAFKINTLDSPWFGRTLFDIYTQAHTPYEWYPKIKAVCDKHNVICFSSPFSPCAVDYLEKHDCPAYKIASLENNYYPLIKSCAITGKPLIMSSGATALEELDLAVAAAKAANVSDLVILHCSSTYPSPISESKIHLIPYLRHRFNIPIGFSDHTLGATAAVAAVANGAVVIEKHIKHYGDNEAIDASFSMDPSEFANLVHQCREAALAVTATQQRDDCNSSSRILRRSLFYSQALKKGTLLESTHLVYHRPSIGLSPNQVDLVLGKPLIRDVKMYDPIQTDDFLT